MATLVPEIYISDYARSLAFYTGLLGFSVRYDRPEEGFAYLERDGAELMLDTIDGGTRSWITAPLETPFGRGVNFQIQVRDIATLHRAVLDAGVSLYLPLEDKRYRCGDGFVVNRQFIVCDPDGYMLRFFQDVT